MQNFRQLGIFCTLAPPLPKCLGMCRLFRSGFLEMFELRRLHSAASMRVLFALAGQKLTFRLRSALQTELKAVLALLQYGQGAVGNFSFSSPFKMLFSAIA